MAAKGVTPANTLLLSGMSATPVRCTVELALGLRLELSFQDLNQIYKFLWALCLIPHKAWMMLYALLAIL